MKRDEIDEAYKKYENKKLLLSIVQNSPNVSLEWAIGLQRLFVPAQYEIMRMAGLPIDVARNFVSQTALERMCDYVFFLDTDVIPPEDAISKLLDADKDIVGALYYQRFRPWAPVAFLKKASKKGIGKTPISGWQKGDIVPCTFLHMGATLVRTSVFLIIDKPFIWTLDIDNPNGLSEDFYFTSLAAEKGFSVCCHTGVIAKHEFSAIVTDEGCGPILQ